MASWTIFLCELVVVDNLISYDNNNSCTKIMQVAMAMRGRRGRGRGDSRKLRWYHTSWLSFQKKSISLHFCIENSRKIFMVNPKFPNTKRASNVGDTALLHVTKVPQNSSFKITRILKICRYCYQKTILCTSYKCNHLHCHFGLICKGTRVKYIKLRGCWLLFRGSNWSLRRLNAIRSEANEEHVWYDTWRTCTHAHWLISAYRPLREDEKAGRGVYVNQSAQILP